MRIKALLYSLPLLFLASCATTRPPEAGPISPPVVVAPPATPAVRAVDKVLEKVIETNHSLTQKNDQLKKEADSAISDAQSAREELDAMRKDPTKITPAKLEELSNSLTMEQEHNAALKDQVAQIGTKIADQEKQLVDTADQLDKAETATIAKDSENAQLRQSDEALRTQVDVWSKRSAALEKEANDWHAQYSSAAPYKNWCIALGVIAVIMVVISIALKRMIPYIPR